ncbi:hypothetical protein JKP88DRAFT_348274 [Tribonema minus]|uniref:Uncharacterized protein n=1 Tax=Tribonema minus TaxID=303371 RepID=A0A836CIY3_9STRA|nr:hypothetical protein JKP88DRAFT_348274 [Tribonema minus]
MVGKSACTLAVFAMLAAASAKSLRGGYQTQRSLDVSPLYKGEPYKAIEVPGVLEAEFFDVGGEGVTYHTVVVPVVLPANVIRLNEDGAKVTVQINDLSADVGGSEPAGAIGVGMGVTGEWQRYTITALQDGTYLPTWRIATFDPAGGVFPVETTLTIGTGAEADPCALPGAGGLDLAGINTGDYKTFMSYKSKDPITIPAGEHVLTMCYTNVNTFEINYIDFGKPVPGGGDTAAPSAIPGSMAPSTAPSAAPSAAPNAAGGATTSSLTDDYTTAR